ncbi:MAG: hypothetical protein KC442_09110 [Thermomicrobiales bacterium]|nr:hypothetical protein [Thermomicrobiales bacterium]
MDGPLAQALTDWIPFYALAGAAAATLLGLLFVAASLRLAIFRDPHTADVSFFASFIFATMLGAMIVAGLALVPHQHRWSLVWPLASLGAAGVVMTVVLFRLWVRLNPPGESGRSRLNPWTWTGKVLMVTMASPAVVLLLACWLMVVGRDSALFVLAIAEGLLLILPTGCAWLLVTHARPDG